MTMREIRVKDAVTKSNLPVCDYSLNPYVGCGHGCKYCYACFMKRFTWHTEPWGEFVDVKYWDGIKNPDTYCGKEIFIARSPTPISRARKRTGAPARCWNSSKAAGQSCP